MACGASEGAAEGAAEGAERDRGCEGRGSDTPTLLAQRAALESAARDASRRILAATTDFSTLSGKGVRKQVAAELGVDAKDETLKQCVKEEVNAFVERGGMGAGAGGGESTGVMDVDGDEKPTKKKLKVDEAAAKAAKKAAKAKAAAKAARAAAEAASAEAAAEQSDGAEQLDSIETDELLEDADSEGEFESEERGAGAGAARQAPKAKRRAGQGGRYAHTRRDEEGKQEARVTDALRLTAAAAGFPSNELCFAERSRLVAYCKGRTARVEITDARNAVLRAAADAAAKGEALAYATAREVALERLRYSKVLGGTAEPLAQELLAFLSEHGAVNNGLESAAACRRAAQEWESNAPQAQRDGARALSRRLVAVVGAGAAGLAAARALQRRGITCVVLEGRQRIGGRINTERDTFSAPVELGASLITGTEAIIEEETNYEKRPDPSTQLCEAAGLSMHTLPKGALPLFDATDGSLIDRAVDDMVFKAFDDVCEDLRKVADRDIERESDDTSLEPALRAAWGRRRSATLVKVATLLAERAAATAIGDNGVAVAEPEPAAQAPVGGVEQVPLAEPAEEPAAVPTVESARPAFEAAAEVTAEPAVPAEPAEPEADAPSEVPEAAVLESPPSPPPADDMAPMEVDAPATAPAYEQPQQPQQVAKVTPEVEDIVDRLFEWHVAHLEYGCSAKLGSLSLQHWTDDELFGAFGGEHRMIGGGWTTMAERLAKGLEVRLGRAVREISYGATDGPGRAVTLQVERTDSGAMEEVECDAVIVTVPLGVLKAGSIAFDPVLPTAKTKAIERLGFGGLEKLVLEFPEAFWESHPAFAGKPMVGVVAPPDRAAHSAAPVDGGGSDDDDMVGDDLVRQSAARNAAAGRCFMFWNGALVTGRPILTTLLAGEAAAAVLRPGGAAIALAHALRVLRTIFGEEEVPEPVAWKVTDWATDEFSHGSYSSTGIGSSYEDYDRIMAPVSRQVFFAGEHTCKEHPDTVGGALLSGLREAARVAGTLAGERDLKASVDLCGGVTQQDFYLSSKEQRERGVDVVRLTADKGYGAGAEAAVALDILANNAESDKDIARRVELQQVAETMIGADGSIERLRALYNMVVNDRIPRYPAPQLEVAGMLTACLAARGEGAPLASKADRALCKEPKFVEKVSKWLDSAVTFNHKAVAERLVGLLHCVGDAAHAACAEVAAASGKDSDEDVEALHWSRIRETASDALGTARDTIYLKSLAKDALARWARGIRDARVDFFSLTGGYLEDAAEARRRAAAAVKAAEAQRALEEEVGKNVEADEAVIAALERARKLEEEAQAAQAAAAAAQEEREAAAVPVVLPSLVDFDAFANAKGSKAKSFRKASRTEDQKKRKAEGEADREARRAAKEARRAEKEARRAERKKQHDREGGGGSASGGDGEAPAAVEVPEGAGGQAPTAVEVAPTAAAPTADTEASVAVLATDNPDAVGGDDFAARIAQARKMAETLVADAKEASGKESKAAGNAGAGAGVSEPAGDAGPLEEGVRAFVRSLLRPHYKSKAISHGTYDDLTAKATRKVLERSGAAKNGSDKGTDAKRFLTSQRRAKIGDIVEKLVSNHKTTKKKK